MLLEYHLKRGDRILLLVPKSARDSVWESAIDRYLRPHYRLECKANLQIHFLTATPINNSLCDLYHLINYIAHDDQKYFATRGGRRA